MKDIFNRKEAARRAGVSERTILRAIASNQLVAVKIGEGKTSTYLIEKQNFVEYMEKRKERKSQ